MVSRRRRRQLHFDGLGLRITGSSVVVVVLVLALGSEVGLVLGIVSSASVNASRVRGRVSIVSA